MEWISQPWARWDKGTNVPLTYSLMGMLSCAGICGVLKFHRPTPLPSKMGDSVPMEYSEEFWPVCPAGIQSSSTTTCFAKVNLLPTISTIDSGPHLRQAPCRAWFPQVAALSPAAGWGPFCRMGEAELQFDAGYPRPCDFAVLSGVRQIH